MKFLLVTLTVLLSVFNTKSYATDVNVSQVVIESFKNSFESATEVKWSYSDNLYKADFAYHGQYIAAYFDVQGEMVAATRNIASSQLPIGLQTNLKKDYQGFWISNLFELSDASGTTYYVTLENADNKIVLKSEGSVDWSTFQKQKKS